MEGEYIFTKSLNCAAYILYKTKCVPEIVQSDDIEDYNTFRFIKNNDTIDAYNLYKSKKSLEQNLYINNLFNYNFAIKKCKELIREYKNNLRYTMENYEGKMVAKAMRSLRRRFQESMKNINKTEEELKAELWSSDNDCS